MKRVNVLVAVMILILELHPLRMQSQDLHFFQFTMTPLQIDPSQSGKFRGDQRAIINYRDQWSSIMTRPFRTYGLSFDMPFNTGGGNDHFFGIGLTAFSDKAGEISLGTSVVNVNIAYHLKVTQSSYLSAGLKAGIRQNSIDVANLRFDSQFDGSGHNAALPSGEVIEKNSFFKPDFSAGVSYSFGTNTSSDAINNNGYSGKKINVGFAAHHVSAPDYSFLEGNNDRMNLKYVFYALTSFGIGNTNLAIQPSGYVLLQEGATNMVAGSYFRYTLKEQSKYTGAFKGSALSIGAHYRLRDAFIPSVLIETGSLAFGISYDINLSGLAKVTNGNGGLEFSIRYINPNPFSKRKNQARFF